MKMSYKEAAEVLRNPVEGLKVITLDGEPEVGLTSDYCTAIEVALEALEKLDKIAPVGDVYPDWYDRLSELDYNYDPVKDGTPWYRADDVWACVEEIPDGHREFGAHMDEEVADG